MLLVYVVSLCCCVLLWCVVVVCGVLLLMLFVVVVVAIVVRAPFAVCCLWIVVLSGLRLSLLLRFVRDVGLCCCLLLILVVVIWCFCVRWLFVSLWLLL